MEAEDYLRKAAQPYTPGPRQAQAVQDPTLAFTTGAFDYVAATHEPKDKTLATSDGGPSAYYDFPPANTLNDLIEYRGMSFAQGNIFKACFRLGLKDGAPPEYDLRKIIYYAQRMLNQIEGKQ